MSRSKGTLAGLFASVTDATAIPRTEGDTSSPSPLNDEGMDLPVEWVTGTVTAPYGHPMALVAYSVSGDIRWRISLS